MDHLIEVAFKGNRREFFRWTFEAPPPVHAAIIVEVERGEDLGHVHATGELAERRRAGTTHGKEQREPLRTALRLAATDDITKAGVLRTDEEQARRFAVQKVRALTLQMKISDAEWQWDRRRLTFYFTAEERVDFRTLVRQLEGHFGVRVQMWHIGPRDEARRLDGVGHCGRQLCSSSWLPELLPVKTSLAKEQRLSTITPTQISGACGRLMCCLRYEHEFYVAARKRFPKQGKIVQTLEGEEKVDGTDIFRDLVTLRNPAGDVRTIPLAQFRRELAGETMPVDDEARDDEHAEEGEERATPPAQAVAPQRTRSAPPGREGHKAREPRRDARAESAPPARTDARTERRPDPRAEPRGEPRGDPRGEPLAAQTPDKDRDSRRPTSHEQHPRHESRPARSAPPAPAATSIPREMPVEPAPPPASPAPLDATHSPDTASADGEHRRGRRRRGRRGGRRHRGDGQHPGTTDGADAPPSNTDD